MFQTSDTLYFCCIRQTICLKQTSCANLLESRSEWSHTMKTLETIHHSQQAHCSSPLWGSSVNVVWMQLMAESLKCPRCIRHVNWACAITSGLLICTVVPCAWRNCTCCLACCLAVFSFLPVTLVCFSPCDSIQWQFTCITHSTPMTSSPSVSTSGKNYFCHFSQKISLMLAGLIFKAPTLLDSCHGGLQACTHLAISPCDGAPLDHLWFDPAGFHSHSAGNSCLALMAPTYSGLLPQYSITKPWWQPFFICPVVWRPGDGE